LLSQALQAIDSLWRATVSSIKMLLRAVALADNNIPKCKRRQRQCAISRAGTNSVEPTTGRVVGEQMIRTRADAQGELVAGLGRSVGAEAGDVLAAGKGDTAGVQCRPLITRSSAPRCHRVPMRPNGPFKE
jgi:hypothetical protein